MSLNRFFNNFTAGELTPLLDGRSDIQQYDRGARTLENVRVLPYGGLTMRAGLGYVAAVKTAAKKTRLIPFNFSTGTRFVLEFGDTYVRFYSNGVQVESGGSPYEIATPYVEADLFRLQFKQINDIVYIAHPRYAPRKLSRVADTNWTLSEIAWTYPPLREENTSDVTLAISNGAVGTGRTLTASASTFVSGHVGSYWELRHRREGDSVELDVSGSSGTSNSTALTIKGDWQVISTQSWYGTLEVQRSEDGGATWKTVRKFKSASDRNVSASGSESEECQLRLKYTATGDPYGTGVWVGTAPTAFVKAKAKLESTEAFVGGLVQITAVASATSATATVVQAISSTAATDIWSEGAWSTYRGFPRAVSIFEQRLYFGGNLERPTRFWGSKTGDFENFEYSEDDDGAVAFDVAATEANAIQWLESLQRLLLSTGGQEFTAGAGDTAEPLTPSNVSVRGQSAFGSDYLQPVLVDNAVVFLQRQGKKLREMTFDIQRDGYVAPDLTLLAEHITESGVVQLAFSRQPDPMILAVLGNGELAVCTYDREQQVTAWTRWITDGAFESVCSVYGPQADEIWAVVRRTADSYQVATRIRETAYDDYHSLRQTGINLATNVPHTLVVYLKRAGGRNARLSLGRVDTTNYGVAEIDLGTGAVVTSTIGSGTVNASVTATVDGFWRCALEFDRSSSNSSVTIFVVKADGTQRYPGTWEGGLLVSNPMLVQASMATALSMAYEATTSSVGVSNKLLWSANFAATAWVKNQVMVHEPVNWNAQAQTVRYVEKLAVESETKADARLLDSWVETLVEPEDGFATLYELGHLNGKTARVVRSSGEVVGDFAVIGSIINGVPIAEPGTCVVGLPYTAKVKPMKLDVVMANGPSQGKKRRITQLVLRFRNTYGAKFGKVDSALDTVIFSGTDLFTGDKVVNFPLGHDRSGDIVVVQDQPMPFTLLGILASADFFGD